MFPFCYSCFYSKNGKFQSSWMYLFMLYSIWISGFLKYICINHFKNEWYPFLYFNIKIVFKNAEQLNNELQAIDIKLTKVHNFHRTSLIWCKWMKNLRALFEREKLFCTDIFKLLSTLAVSFTELIIKTTKLYGFLGRNLNWFRSCFYIKNVNEKYVRILRCPVIFYNSVYTNFFETYNTSTGQKRK